MADNDIIEVECAVRIDKPDWRTIGVANGDTEMHQGKEREKIYWLPRKLIKVSEDEKSVTMPQWLAQYKGLI